MKHQRGLWGHVWPWSAGLGTAAPSLPALSWHTSFLPLGPDARVGGLFPFAGRLQEEQAEMASAGRAAGEDAGERGQRPGQAQLRSTRASVASRRTSASTRGAGHCPGVVCASTAVFYFCTTSRAQHAVSLGDPSIVLCICFMPLSCADRHVDASATCALKVRAASSP